MLTDPFEIIVPGGKVLVSLEAYEDAGRIICGICELEGKISMKPKAWVTAVRAEVAKLEHIAREAGCAEMRIAGRDWSRILPDYQPFDGAQNGIRKAL